DSKNSALYQQYGNEIVSLMANYQPRPFDWAKDKTTNYGICPSLDIVQDTIVNLQKTLVTQYDADGVYLDEINTISPDDCYNANHGHPLGTGNRWTASYNRLMERIMKECSEAKGEPIVIFSEGTAEPFVTVACLDLSVRPYSPYAISALYSGYRIQWAMQYNASDFEPSQLPAIAKMAYTLMGGWQLGWYEYLPSGKDYKDVPDFTLYQKNACLARYHAVNYMNLGEMVRPAAITNNIPNIDVQIALNVTEKTPYYSVPAVQTSSWNYKGKTALVFTNITKEKQHIVFETEAEKINLPKKDSYKLTETFPVQKEISDSLKGEFDINPLETAVIIAE
ncbi:MAG: hypothetical protein KBT47_00280, partial [Armatimonadetes bacterium]|nr:hypothetical protein [Candidatus Hippobium faecium]